MFCDDGSVAAFDFQLIGTGSGSYDLAYFVTQSLEPNLASAQERALFERWTAGLTAGGVPEGDLGRLWEDYRKAALFCLVYPIVASRGMDLDDPRQRGLVECMMRPLRPGGGRARAGRAPLTEPTAWRIRRG